MPQPKQYPDKHRKTTGNNRQNLLKNKEVFSFSKPPLKSDQRRVTPLTFLTLHPQPHRAHGHRFYRHGSTQGVQD